MIAESGVIIMILPFGDYPATVEPNQRIGKNLDALQDFVEGTDAVREAILKTIQTGRGETVHGSVNGRRRIGMTIFVNHFYAIMRLFTTPSSLIKAFFPTC
jgi:hypothetical protein